jgi:hypothetical protein
VSRYIQILGVHKKHPDWHQHKKIWDACTKLGILFPNETLKFFGEEGPKEHQIDLRDPVYRCSNSRSTPNRNYITEIQVDAIPKGIETIKIIESEG